MWDGLRFELRAPSVAADLERADVACFVGQVRLRDGAVPEAVREVWRRLGWSHLVPADPAVHPAAPLPVVVASVEEADGLLDGWVRTADGLAWEGYLLGAVRDFFRQGGRRAWIVPVGPPDLDPVGEAARAVALDALIPGAFGGAAAEPGARDTWRGLGHLFTLSDVAFVCLPDLPALVGGTPLATPALPPDPVPVPGFAECARPDPAPPGGVVRRAPGPPALDAAAWSRWQAAVHAAVAFVRRHRPDVVVLAALPLTDPGDAAAADPLPALLPRLDTPASGGLGTSWLQLAAPWFKGDTTGARRGGIAPPDGLLAGLLARNALAQGTFRLAAPASPVGVTRLEPTLAPRALRRALPPPGRAEALRLDQRVCLLDRTPRGLRLISDVTASPDPQWRQGGIGRLLGVVRRLVQRVGETTVHEPSGPATWRALRERVGAALGALAAEGALGTGLRGDAWDVRCGPSTMTQADLDAGRLIVEVDLRPTIAIERITVVLTLTDGGASDGRQGAA